MEDLPFLERSPWLHTRVPGEAKRRRFLVRFPTVCRQARAQDSCRFVWLMEPDGTGRGVGVVWRSHSRTGRITRSGRVRGEFSQRFMGRGRGTEVTRTVTWRHPSIKSSLQILLLYKLHPSIKSSLVLLLGPARGSIRRACGMAA
jgi:hypothetical protein